MKMTFNKRNRIMTRCQLMLNKSLLRWTTEFVVSYVSFCALTLFTRLCPFLKIVERNKALDEFAMSQDAAGVIQVRI